VGILASSEKKWNAFATDPEWSRLAQDEEYGQIVGKSAIKNAGTTPFDR